MDLRTSVAIYHFPLTEIAYQPFRSDPPHQTVNEKRIWSGGGRYTYSYVYFVGTRQAQNLPSNAIHLWKRFSVHARMVFSRGMARQGGKDVGGKLFLFSNTLNFHWYNLWIVRYSGSL